MLTLLLMLLLLRPVADIARLTIHCLIPRVVTHHQLWRLLLLLLRLVPMSVQVQLRLLMHCAVCMRHRRGR